ncbi:hypothetical protein PPACK8108_LOCUS2139 [Phakopsora pachyrhizi]|uniref:Uncharacterized protein n=1 Tax=Phakopsora pachyrhizi TaxID=170000 RepID=A0AAV0AL68_PHAPC|nr:hypothetical protein PPACK8108_LOCUS2139 [Phakopsora pachyrhizi]
MKSSAKNLTPHIFSIRYVNRHPRSFHLECRCPLMMVHKPKLYFDATFDARDKIIVSSTDSGLEAFSHNPTHGSFTPLSSQTVVNTNYVNEQFLLY